MINKQSIQMTIDQGIAFVRSTMNYARINAMSKNKSSVLERPMLVKQHTIGPNTRIYEFLGTEF